MYVKDNSYNSGDPFFVVTCRDCGKEYWSTRKVNVLCIRCGSSNIDTHIPEHTIRNYTRIRK